MTKDVLQNTPLFQSLVTCLVSGSVIGILVFVNLHMTWLADIHVEYMATAREGHDQRGLQERANEDRRELQERAAESRRESQEPAIERGVFPQQVSWKMTRSWKVVSDRLSMNWERS